MAEERTEASRYKSESSGEFATVQQKITELLMLRKYAKNKRRLPYRFWMLDEYKAEFQKTIILVNRTANSKGWDLDALLNVLVGEGKFIYSLFFPKLDDMVIKQMSLQKALEDMKTPTVVENPEQRKKTFGKKTTGGRLG